MTVYEQIFGGEEFGVCGTSRLESADEIILMTNAKNDNPPTVKELKRQSRMIKKLVEVINGE